MPNISYGPIAITVSELATAIVNRLDRGADAHLTSLHPGLPTLLKFTVNVSAETFRAVKYLVLDPHQGEGPPPEHAVAVTPLARTFVDSLMTIVCVFANPTTNARLYFRGGWRSARELHEERRRRFASEPSGPAWLAEHRTWIDSHEADFQITRAESSDPGKVPRWPNPGRFKDLIVAQDRRDFLTFLNEYFYGELSQDAHLSYMGLARRAGVLDEQHANENLKAYRSQVFLTSLSLYFALLSEVIGEARLPEEARRIAGVWAYVMPACPDACELWSRRYEALLRTVKR